MTATTDNEGVETPLEDLPGEVKEKPASSSPNRVVAASSSPSSDPEREDGGSSSDTGDKEKENAAGSVDAGGNGENTGKSECWPESFKGSCTASVT